MKTFLVTGGTGYIGHKFSEKLLGMGHNVVIFCRSKSSKRIEHENLTYWEIESNGKRVDQGIERFRPYFTFHFATQYKDIDKQSLDKVNFDFGVTLLKSLIKYELSNFVNFGTYWQYGESGQGVRPLNGYAASKEKFMQYLEELSLSKKIKSINFILYDVYGMDDWRPKILNILPKKKEFSFSDCSQNISFVNVNDVVNNVINLMNFVSYNSERVFVHDRFHMLKDVLIQIQQNYLPSLVLSFDEEQKNNIIYNPMQQEVDERLVFEHELFESLKRKYEKN